MWRVAQKTKQFVLPPRVLSVVSSTMRFVRISSSVAAPQRRRDSTAGPLRSLPSAPTQRPPPITKTAWDTARCTDLGVTSERGEWPGLPTFAHRGAHLRAWRGGVEDDPQAHQELGTVRRLVHFNHLLPAYTWHRAGVLRSPRHHSELQLDHPGMGGARHSDDFARN